MINRTKDIFKMSVLISLIYYTMSLTVL